MWCEKLSRNNNRVRFRVRVLGLELWLDRVKLEIIIIIEDLPASKAPLTHRYNGSKTT